MKVVVLVLVLMNAVVEVVLLLVVNVLGQQIRTFIAAEQ